MKQKALKEPRSNHSETNNSTLHGTSDPNPMIAQLNHFRHQLNSWYQLSTKEKKHVKRCVLL